MAGSAECVDECTFRCFPNPWLKDPLCKLDAKPGDQEGKLQMVLSDMKPRLLSEINKCLDKVEEYVCHSTDKSDESVYTGSAGIALFYLQMALRLYQKDPDKKRQYLQKSLDHIFPVRGKPTTRRPTFLCGSPGALAIASVVLIYLDRTVEARECIDKLVTFYTTHREEFEKIPCEILYGCAGYLYSLLFVNCYVKNAITRDIIEEVQELLISQGKSGRVMTTPSPLMYTWHSKHYLGAAHGLAGILTVLIQDASESAIISRDLGVLQGAVDYLLTVQLPSKNFPSSIESMAKDRLVQWCHGAPGFVHLWSTAYRVFNKSDYLKAARDCGELVWEKGLLRKGHGLCHGVSGNGYTFLQLYRTTGDPAYLHRALKFAEWCITRECPKADSPYSLFEGLLGRAYFYMELLCVDPSSLSLDEARFPALEIPHVPAQQKLSI